GTVQGDVAASLASGAKLFALGLVAALDDFLAAIETIRRNPVPRVRLARRRVDRQRRTPEMIVRAVHAALGRGLSALLNCHGSFLQQISQTRKRLLDAVARALLVILRRRLVAFTPRVQ